jgi:N-acetylmuramoyl-L-alanine amidase
MEKCLVVYRMRKLDLIIIHCSATPNGRSTTVADIDSWHKQRGFTGIGYHYVIYLDGSVHDGRPLDKMGAHAAGYNRGSIGICLIGTDEFTVKQWDALENLVTKLQEEYGITMVIGHRMLPKVNKTCPGFNVKEWMQDGKVPLEDHILTI